MLYICIIELGHHWFRKWLVSYSAPSHYLNQCWIIANFTLRNKLQWNVNQNTKLFIHENVSENVVCEMAAILSRKMSLMWCRSMFNRRIEPLALNVIFWYTGSFHLKHEYQGHWNNVIIHTNVSFLKVYFLFVAQLVDCDDLTFSKH